MAKPAVPVTSVETEETVTPAVTIVLDDESAEMFEGCEVGDEKWVRMRVETKSERTITATPLEVEYEEEAAAEPEQDAETGEVVPRAIGKISKGGY